MAGIVDNFSYPVILLDNQDADVSWDNHLARGSDGGVDLAYPYGSPVLANAAGVVTNVAWYGTGGHTVRLTLPDGRYIEYMHLSSFSVSTGATVSIGTRIGLSGASGSNNLNYYAPHLHVHMYIQGTRVNLFNYFTYTSGDDMPTRYTTGRDANFAVTKYTQAQADSAGWPALPYTDGTATNLAELVPSASIFDVTASFYLTGLLTGQSVTVRLALQAKSNNVISAFPMITLPGSDSGVVRAQLVGNAEVNQSTHRLLIQLFGSATGITVDLWRSSVLSW